MGNMVCGGLGGDHGAAAFATKMGAFIESAGPRAEALFGELESADTLFDAAAVRFGEPSPLVRAAKRARSVGVGVALRWCRSLTRRLRAA